MATATRRSSKQRPPATNSGSNFRSNRTSPRSIGTSLANQIKSPFRKQKSQVEDFDSQTLSSPIKSENIENIVGSEDVRELETLGTAPHPPCPPPILTIQTEDRNSLAIIEAINSLQATMVEFHLNLERKMDSKLTSVEGQLRLLNSKLRNQDKAISDLRRNMVDTNSLKQTKESLSNVASQADQKFVDIDRELIAFRIKLNAHHIKNLRLNHRVFETEEKT